MLFVGWYQETDVQSLSSLPLVLFLFLLIIMAVLQSGRESCFALKLILPPPHPAPHPSLLIFFLLVWGMLTIYMSYVYPITSKTCKISIVILLYFRQYHGLLLWQGSVLRHAEAIWCCKVGASTALRQEMVLGSLWGWFPGLGWLSVLTVFLNYPQPSSMADPCYKMLCCSHHPQWDWNRGAVAIGKVPLDIVPSHSLLKQLLVSGVCIIAAEFLNEFHNGSISWFR